MHVISCSVIWPACERSLQAKLNRQIPIHFKLSTRLACQAAIQLGARQNSRLDAYDFPFFRTPTQAHAHRQENWSAGDMQNENKQE